MDPNHIAVICTAVSLVISGAASFAKDFGEHSPDDAANSRRNRKLVTLGWGVCGSLATLIVMLMAIGAARNSSADASAILGIGVVLLIVICVGTWVVS